MTDVSGVVAGGPRAATSVVQGGELAGHGGGQRRVDQLGQGLDGAERLPGRGLGGVHVDQAEVGGLLLADGQGRVDHPVELVDGHGADGLGPEPLAGQQELGHRGLCGQGGHVGGERTADPQVALDGMEAAEGLTGCDVGRRARRGWRR